MSVHKKLTRNRKPRVHITYDVETGGAEEKKELPFNIGVLGDYVGNKPGKSAGSLKERKFVNIDNENFDDVMARMEPGVSMSVKDTLSGEEDKNMGIDLKFSRMDDFSPEAIVEQVDPLKKLLETRNKLRDLLTKVDRSEELESILEDVLTNTEKLEDLANQVKKDDKGGE